MLTKVFCGALDCGRWLCVVMCDSIDTTTKRYGTYDT